MFDRSVSPRALLPQQAKVDMNYQSTNLDGSDRDSADDFRLVADIALLVVRGIITTCRFNASSSFHTTNVLTTGIYLVNSSQKPQLCLTNLPNKTNKANLYTYKRKKLLTAALCSALNHSSISDSLSDFKYHFVDALWISIGCLERRS